MSDKPTVYFTAVCVLCEVRDDADEIVVMATPHGGAAVCKDSTRCIYRCAIRTRHAYGPKAASW